MIRALVASLAALGATLVAPLTASPAHADGPGVGSPWVVSVGDSYISGEAGRWAAAHQEDGAGDRKGLLEQVGGAEEQGHVVRVRVLVLGQRRREQLQLLHRPREPVP